MGERESPDFGLRATFRGARLAGSHSNHIVSPEGKLASYLTPCLNRSTRGPQEPETRAEPSSFSSPRSGRRTRPCATDRRNFAPTLPTKPPAANFRQRKDSSAPLLRNVLGRLLDLLKIKFAWFRGDPWPIIMCIFAEMNENWLIFVSIAITCRVG